jgi:aminoglycoside phosphotransferase (APT) family kinase protein
MDAYRRHWRGQLLKVRERLFPSLTPGQRDWATDAFIGFLGDEENFSFEPKVIHGDLDASNVLVDPGTLEVTGVIDFEEAKPWDPAPDLLFLGEGETLRDQILASYRHPTGPNLEQRTLFHARQAPLAYILTGLETGNRRMTEAGHEMLTRWMNADAVRH